MQLVARVGWPVLSLAIVAAALSPGCKCGGQSLRSQVPQIEVTPAALAIQPLPAGKSSLSIVQVRNAGNADLHFKGDPAVFDTDNDGSDAELGLVAVLDYDCTGTKRTAAARLTLGPGECARLVVQYSPANLDRDTGDIKIETDDPDRPVVHVPISMGDAAQMAICFHSVDGTKIGCDGPDGAPPTVAFGQVNKGNTAKRIVRLENKGKNPLDISSVLPPDGTHRKEFAADLSKVPSKLQPGAFADILVTLSPVGGGTRTAWIQIDSADPVRPTVQVPLQGQGEGPALCATPNPVDFGTSNIGTIAEKKVTLSSCGTAPVQMQKLEFDQLSSVAFTATSLPPPQTLAVGAKVEVTLQFRPDSPGATSGALLTPTPEVPEAYVLLKGGGLEAPICRLDAATQLLDFGQVVRGQTRDQEVRLANRGKANCTLKGMTIALGSSYYSVTDPISNPIMLRPGDVFTFNIRYAPPGNDTNPQDVGTATADSDDPLRPKLDVKLVGVPVAAPICKLSITPATGGFFSGRTLQFGNVTVGKTKVMPVTFKNVGSANCTLSGSKFVSNDLSSPCSAGSCQGFSVIPPLAQSTLAPGQSTQVSVQFAPRSENEIPFLPTVYLQVPTSDKAIPTECIQGFPPNPNDGCVSVGMAGQGVISNLAVLPSDLDFGVVTLGCRSRTENVTLYNTGTAVINVKSLRIDGPNVNSFLLVAPPTPFTLAGGQKISIQVTFKPSGVGRESASLYIESDASNTSSNNPYMTVALSGTGTTDKHQKDTFTQQTKPTVDLLFVIDNSGSFEFYQQKLSEQAPKFIQRALTYNADYHIAVTSNGVQETMRADSNSSYPGDTIYPGGLFGRPSIIGNSTPNASDAFAKNVRVGTCCADAKESGLEAPWMVLSPPSNQKAPPEGSLGFLRDEARLVIVNVADEVDQSRGSTDFYVDFFQQLKGRYNAGLVSYNSIMGDPKTGCDINGGHVPAGDRYADVVTRTGGKWWSICSADWGKVADDLSLDAFRGRVQFALTRPADPATISVTVNAAPQNNPNDYSFDQASNSIIFKLPPPQGATIVAEYDALCL